MPGPCAVHAANHAAISASLSGMRAGHTCAERGGLAPAATPCTGTPDDFRARGPRQDTSLDSLSSTHGCLVFDCDILRRRWAATPRRRWHRRCPSGSARWKSSQPKAAESQAYDDRRTISLVYRCASAWRDDSTASRLVFHWRTACEPRVSNTCAWSSCGREPAALRTGGALLVRPAWALSWR